uniref:Uncharacterized protein n=1 Tax=Ditylenchus dipsaci TaxID=166011 RepID=A0A915ETK4_9BILA
MVFPLQEVRSYISNSTESCWSPHSSEGTSNAPRAYSLGSKPTQLSTQRHQNLEEEEGANRAISSVSVTLPPGCSASLQPHSCLSPPRNRPTTTPNDSNTSLSSSANVPGDKQGDPLVSSTIVNWRGGVSAANTAATTLDTEDMRKRAHSVGSKSWIKQAASIRKMSAKKNVVASSSTAETPRTEATTSGVLESEARDRADSTGSRTSSLFGVTANFDNHSRRNTNRSSASHPDSQDHVEIDFDRDGSCASIESPLNRSRNSSVGVQMPSSNAQHNGEKPSDRFISLGKADLTAKSSNGDEPQVVRKRSVPEMTVLDTNNCNTSNHSSHHQLSTSQRRRSTYDCTTASSLSAAAHLARFRAKANTNHHLLHPATPKPVSSGRFTSLSTSSGISSRSSEPSISTLPLQISAPDCHQQPLEDEEDDYVMMGGGSASENTQASINPQQPRLISTIIESAYSSSTTSLTTSCESSESASEEPQSDQQVKSKQVAVPHVLVKSKEMPLSRVVIEKHIEKVEEDHEDYGIIVHTPVANPKTPVKKEVRECKGKSPGRSPKFVGQKSGTQGPVKGPSTSPGQVQRKISNSRDEPDHAVNIMTRKMTYGGSTGCPMVVDGFRKHSSSSCSPQSGGGAGGSRKHRAVVVPEKKEQCDYAVVKPSVAEGGGRRE